MKIQPKPFGDVLPARFIAGLYGFIVACRNRYYNGSNHRMYYPPVPTISIGGVHAGGTGKTPLCAFVADYLLNHRHMEVAILSRGYGRSQKAPAMIHPHQQTSWKEAGDEPAMIHAALPRTWLGIGADRSESARRILKEAAFAGDRFAFVLDDGFQHRRIARHLDIVCLPPMHRNPRLIPVGYLREPIKNVQRADLACIIASKNDLAGINWTQRYVRSQTGEGFPVVVLLSKPGEWVNLHTGEKRLRLGKGHWGLISGIANPQRFVETVKTMGISPAYTAVYPDHHAFTRKDIEQSGRQKTTGIITTEKDACRMRTLKLVKAQEIWYLRVSLDFYSHMDKTIFYNTIDSIFSFSRNRRKPS